MATQRQKKLAKAIVENAVAEKPKTMGELVENSGYSKNTATKQLPAVVNQKGVQDEIKTMIGALKAQGITPVKIAEKINVLLNAEKKVRQIIRGELTTEYEEEDTNAIDKGITHSLKLGIGGGYAPEKSLNVNVSVIDDEAITKIADELNAKMTNEVYKGNGISGNGEVPGTVAQKVRDENGEGTSA